MAGAGKKTFTAGEVLTASDVNTYLMEQSVMVFGGTAARSSAIPTPSEGMTTYRTDTNQIESYDGSAWRGMSGLQLVKTQEIGTGVSSVTVTNAFSATYDNYKIVISGGAASAANYGYIKLGSSAASYYYGATGASYATAAMTGLNANGIGDWRYTWNLSATRLSLNMELQNPFLAKETLINSAFHTNTYGFSGAGVHTVSSSFTDFTIGSIGAETITGGTIAVYGYAK